MKDLNYLELTEIGLKIDETIEWAKTHGMTVVLAGGFLRDRILGIEPKDVDFFLETCSAPYQSTMKNRLIQFYGEPDRVEGHAVKTTQEYMNGENQITVLWYSAGRILDYPVNFVLTEGFNVVQKFDFGICQASYNYNTSYSGAPGLYLSQNFLRDMSNEVATLFYSNSKDVEKSKKRYDSWMARGFPFDLVEYDDRKTEADMQVRAA